MSNAVEEVTTTMPPALLVSAAYDGMKKCAVLKFYEPESKTLKLWYDNTGHKPYCYSKLDPEELKFLSSRTDVIKLESVKRQDLIKDRMIDMTKITVTDPLAIGGTMTDKSIRNIMDTWESDIKYYENYLYDNSLIVGSRLLNIDVGTHFLEAITASHDRARRSSRIVLDATGLGRTRCCRSTRCSLNGHSTCGVTRLARQLATKPAV